MLIKQWKYKGLDCCVLKGPASYNGYVRIPPGHPWRDPNIKDYNFDTAVHGGVTFRALVSQDAVEEGHWPMVGYWVGFDTNHYGDRPIYDSEVGKLLYDMGHVDPRGHEWSVMSVAKETDGLAEDVLRAVSDARPQE